MDKLTGDLTYYTALGRLAQQQYNHEYAAGYRTHDELGVKEQWPSHQEFQEVVSNVSASFPHAIDVLDLGCGSGRYFHCHHNLNSLTGVDISADMLAHAAQPVEAHALTVTPRLIEANLADVSFPDEAFDLIYSIGVLGEFMPFDEFISDKITRMLKPGGKLLITVVHDASPRETTWKTRLAVTVMPFLPVSLKRVAKARLRDLALTEAELRYVLCAFGELKIWPRVDCTSGRKHWVCLATK